MTKHESHLSKWHICITTTDLCCTVQRSTVWWTLGYSALSWWKIDVCREESSCDVTISGTWNCCPAACQVLALCPAFRFPLAFNVKSPSCCNLHCAKTEKWLSDGKGCSDPVNCPNFAVLKCNWECGNKRYCICKCSHPGIRQVRTVNLSIYDMLPLGKL